MTSHMYLSPPPDVRGVCVDYVLISCLFHYRISDLDLRCVCALFSVDILRNILVGLGKKQTNVLNARRDLADALKRNHSPNETVT